jgi:hypothetical protein
VLVIPRGIEHFGISYSFWVGKVQSYTLGKSQSMVVGVSKRVKILNPDLSDCVPDTSLVDQAKCQKDELLKKIRTTPNTTLGMCQYCYWPQNWFMSENETEV